MWIMKKGSISISATLGLCLLLSLANLGDSAVTWRRATRPPTTPRTETSTSTTKSAITWKRSTLSRRSTLETEPPSAVEDEIEAADSKEDLTYLEEGSENETSFKPLVPGSRPGFWFDSSRRNKPSRFLRPGSRRNSLFPTKTSTVPTLSTTESITSTPFLPATPTVQESSSEPKPLAESKSKLFGKNRSTKSPISFRRRIKITKAPVTTPINPEPIENNENPVETTNTSQSFDNIQEQQKDEIPRTDLENEEIEKGVTDKPQSSFKISLNGIKRRVRNGTRLSWSPKRGDYQPRATTYSNTTQESDRSITRSFERLTRKTTTSPKTTPRTNSYRTSPPKTSSPRTKHPKTNSSRTSSFEISSPKTRSRTRLYKTTAPSRISWTKSQPTTNVLDDSTKELDKTNLSKFKVPNDYLRNRNTHRFDRLKGSPFIKKGNEKNGHPVILPENEEDLENSAILVNKKDNIFHPTDEPFYITREYGQVVTTIPFENNRKRNRLPSQSTKVPKQSTAKEVLITTSTELPVFTQQWDYTEHESHENDFFKFDDEDFVKNEEKEEFRKDDKDFLDQELQINRTLPKPTTHKAVATSEVTSRPFVTQRVATFEPLISITPPPAFSTIDSGTNGYVVWSLGQDGSGWSYQKHGGHVKWSAQNSEVEGDRWSVQGEEEPIDFRDNLSWSPLRNASYLPSEKKSELKSSKSRENVKFEKELSPISHTSNTPYINETPLKIKTGAEDFRLPPLTESNIFSAFQKSPPNFSTDAVEKSVSLSSFNVDKISTPIHSEVQRQSFNTKANSLETKAFDYEAELNETVAAKPNPLLNTPYLAEIRETFIPSFATAETSTESFVSDMVTDTVTPTTTTPPLEDQTDQNYNIATDYQVDDPTPYTKQSSDNLVSDPNLTVTSSSAPTERVGENTKSDLSGIPPELAKAVVEAKRWTIVGTGGPDGWSLLGEDGKLEWKIHNIGGRWSVTSANQLVNNGHQEFLSYQETPNSSQEDQVQENTETEKSNEAKVWNLEDDYEKWRVVSAEELSDPEAITGVDSLPENWKLNGEYEEYPQDDEVQDDYIYENKNYNVDEGEEIINGGEEGGHFNNDESINFYNDNFEDRPLWGENQMIQNFNDGLINEPAYNENIESVNTKEDAIESWKSLLSDVGKWKLAEGKKVDKNNYNPLSSPSKFPNPSIPEFDSDWKISSRPITIREKKREYFDDYSPTFIDQDYFETSEKMSDQKISEHAYNERIFEDNYLKRRTNEDSAVYKNEEKNIFENDYKNDATRRGNFDTLMENAGRSIKGNDPTYELKPDNVPKEDHEKLDKLIRKLETIHKEANGKAIVDLSQLLKLIKVNRNFTKPNKTSAQNNKTDLQKERFITSLNHNKEQFQDLAVQFPENKLKNIQIPKYSSHQFFDSYQRIQKDTPVYDKESRITNENSRSDTDYKSHVENRESYLNGGYSNKPNEFRIDSQRVRNTARHDKNRFSNKAFQNENSQVKDINSQPPKYMSLPNQSEQQVSTRQQPRERFPKKPQNHRIATIDESQRYKSRDSGIVSDVRDFYSSEEDIVNMRDQPQVNYAYESIPKLNAQRRKRPMKRKHRKSSYHHNSAPIVLSGETYIEDEEGTKKSRKIIVIDYAGKQKKNHSIDRKDLELIIRNVRNKRSENVSDSSDEKMIQDSE